MFIRREDAERFVDEVCGDDPELAAKLRIEECELEGVGEPNWLERLAGSGIQERELEAGGLS